MFSGANEATCQPTQYFPRSLSVERINYTTNETLMRLFKLVPFNTPIYFCPQNVEQIKTNLRLPQENQFILQYIQYYTSGVHGNFFFFMTTDMKLELNKNLFTSCL